MAQLQEGARAIATSIVNADAKTIAGVAQAGTAVLGGVAERHNARGRAKTARRAGKLAFKDERREARKLAAEQEIAFGAGGVVPTEGTPRSVIAATQAEGELMALRRQFAFDAAADNEDQAGLFALAEGLIGGASLAASTPGAARQAGNARNALLKRFGPAEIPKPIRPKLVQRSPRPPTIRARI